MTPSCFPAFPLIVVIAAASFISGAAFASFWMALLAERDTLDLPATDPCEMERDGRGEGRGARSEP